jgi:hypothetical protein
MLTGGCETSAMSTANGERAGLYAVVLSLNYCTNLFSDELMI